VSGRREPWLERALELGDERRDRGQRDGHRYVDRETIFSSLKPGFAVNALTTTTCSITFDGQQLNVTACFTTG
jgi:hypothetical protein